MPTLIDWSIVEGRISEARHHHGYPSRFLAILHVFLEVAFGLTPEEIQEAFTDGPHDRGVDAVVIPEGSGEPIVHLFQGKCVSIFEKASNNFPSGEIDKLLSFISDLLQKEESFEQTANPLLFNRVRDIWELLGHGTPQFEVHLVGNQGHLISTQRDRFTTSLRPYRVFTLQEHGLSEIAGCLSQRNIPRVNADIQLVDNQYFERVDGDVRGLVATVEASKLVELITAPERPGEVRSAIFDENVRVYLGSRNRINTSILESALSPANQEFWYLNNGVTMTCDAMSYPPGVRGPLLTMENLQIVNGGQTCHALFEASMKDPDCLASALVLIRVYETRRPELSAKIAESTNSQTPVRARDLRSNDAIQRKLEEAFLSQGYFYERKANQYRGEDRARRIDALSAAQAYVAYSLEMPSVAGKDRGRIFGDLYDTVFNDDLTAEKLLVPLRVFQPISEMKRDLQTAIRSNQPYDPDLLFLIDGAYHLLYATGLLSSLAGEDRDDPDTAIASIPDAVGVLKKAVAEEAQDPAFAHKRFFKSARARKFIQKYSRS